MFILNYSFYLLTVFVNLAFEILFTIFLLIVNLHIYTSLLGYMISKFLAVGISSTFDKSMCIFLGTSLIFFMNTSGLI